MADTEAPPARAPADMADQIPSMSDAQLKTLLENAVRLQGNGSDRQKMQAERLLPLIKAELAGRKPAPVEKPERPAPARKRAKKTVS